IPVVVTTAPPARAAVNRVRDYRLRATVLEAGAGIADLPAALPLALEVGGKTEPLGDAPLNRPSAWVSLDPYLKDQKGQVLVRISVGGSPKVTRLRLRIEVAD